MHEILSSENFFDGSDLLGPTTIHLRNGIVESIDPCVTRPEFFFLSPGLLDLQMNGFRRVDVADCELDDLKVLDQELFQLGTTQWLATVTTSPLVRLAERIDVLDKICASGQVPGLLGVHIEGPFLGKAPGAHRQDWIIPIDLDWLRNLPSNVRLVTLAPEQEQAVEATEILKKKGIAISMGHGHPTDTEINAMVDAGASMVTHLFNAMSGVHHRESGLALRALVDQRVIAGLISDLSHVSSDAVALSFAAKGSHGVCLVSDSVAWDSDRARRRGVQLIDGCPQIDGTLAGSATPLAQCVQKSINTARVSAVDALTSATATPARILNRAHLTKVKVGSVSNLIALNETFCVVGAWRALVSHRA